MSITHAEARVGIDARNGQQRWAPRLIVVVHWGEKSGPYGRMYCPLAALILEMQKGGHGKRQRHAVTQQVKRGE
ncbi:hypothetical protein BXT84_08010 [Sulfobacillus thermotolerans]|uniref:Uncharacterized protein n=1 Tax=Sulfobacillus thermotolerans TaxID=338644 RepID=A0ABM6RR64_9FIRM|nr:hypothetical protein BXT84_08010 [Sulfobacillus thermotolerans]